MFLTSYFSLNSCWFLFNNSNTWEYLFCNAALHLHVHWIFYLVGETKCLCQIDGGETELELLSPSNLCFFSGRVEYLQLPSIYFSSLEKNSTGIFLLIWICSLYIYSMLYFVIFVTCSFSQFVSYSFIYFYEWN
jgi:hypothetical protein